MASRERPRLRRDGHRARRLPDRELHPASERAAHRRGARLGAFYTRPSARRSRLLLSELPRRGDARAARSSASTSPSSAFPDEARFVARYCELAGREAIEHWAFYMVFVMFRSAAIVQGVYKRGLDGNASSEHAHQFGALVRKRADDAWKLAARESEDRGRWSSHGFSDRSCSLRSPRARRLRSAASQMMLVDDAEMDQMGVEAFEQLKKEQKVSSDASANAYVTCVANAITAALPAGVGGGPGRCACSRTRPPTRSRCRAARSACTRGCSRWRRTRTSSRP